MRPISLVLILLLSLLELKSTEPLNPIKEDKADRNKPVLVFENEYLKVEKLSEHCYRHISYLRSPGFGKIACNGMLILKAGKALVIDAPTNEAASIALIDWLEEEQLEVIAVIASHFHVDCLGGLNPFHARQIPSYAHEKSLALAKADSLPDPQISFRDSLKFQLGSSLVHCQFFGAGHSPDNIVCYFPTDRVLFGGCLLKSKGSGKGNLKDANTKEWPISVERIKKKFPDLELVIPGHGSPGGKDLLDYTIEMFS